MVASNGARIFAVRGGYCFEGTGVEEIAVPPACVSCVNVARVLSRVAFGSSIWE